MAELDFLLTNSEREQLFRWTLELGALIVPDEHYKEPRHKVVSDIDGLNELLSNRQFWIIRKDWLEEELPLHAVDNLHSGAGFRVSQRYGGPAISYLLYPEYSDEGRTILGRGSVHYYPHYYSKVDNRRIEPPEAMKQFFKSVAKFIKKDGVQLKSERRSIWLTKWARDAAVDGSKDVPPEWKQAASEILLPTRH